MTGSRTTRIGAAFVATALVALSSNRICICSVQGAIKGKSLMPSHPQLRGADLDVLDAYVRSLCAAN
jgi:hypothetical protein